MSFAIINLEDIDAGSPIDAQLLAAIKNNFDSLNESGATLPDATAALKGKIKLAGDLGGTVL